MSETEQNWLSVLSTLREAETPCVLITVIDAKGSTPREAGTKMIATKDRQFCTIGGGNLEFEAIERARDLLSEKLSAPEMKKYSLGPSLAQCCGGAVTIMLEPFFEQRKTLYLFGAGHVGKEVVHVLAGLPIKIKWVDERADEFPASMPASATKIVTDAPLDILEETTADDFILIMTHSHVLDYDLVEKALENDRFAYLGLIGSDTKRVKFTRRLQQAGINDTRLTCPIGVEGITGKHPREIALAVAAQVLQLGLSSPHESTEAPCLQKQASS